MMNTRSPKLWALGGALLGAASTPLAAQHTGHPHPAPPADTARADTTHAAHRLELGRHRPYYRIEYATRPEYEREGLPGTEGFYRYDHDSRAIGASRWEIHSLGYETEARGAGLITRPFVEVQYNRVENERGDFSPVQAFGDDRFWSLSAGFKLFLGSDSMRMGNYGVLDPMTTAMRESEHAH